MLPYLSPFMRVELGNHGHRVSESGGEGEGSFDVTTTLPYLIRQPATSRVSRPPRIGER
jgi:hypothetical protein